MNTLILDTKWDIRHTDPEFPDRVVLRMTDDLGTRTYVFDRRLFVEFADHVKFAASVAARSEFCLCDFAIEQVAGQPKIHDPRCPKAQP